MIGILSAMSAELVFGPIYRRLLSKKMRPITNAQLWAIAAGGNLAKLNRSSLTSLHTTKLPRTNRYILSTWWDVRDKDAIRETMDWLRSEGHRAGFQVVHRSLRNGTRTARGRAIIDDEFVRQNHDRFKNGDLVAWDFARLINVARYGFSAGYLREHEAWEAIMMAARHLQTEYSSWKELSENYLLGFSYWQDGAPPDECLVEASRWLDESPDSPWRKLRWSEPLG